MNSQDLFLKIAEDKWDEVYKRNVAAAKNPFFEVVTAINYGMPDDEQRLKIIDVRWDHETQQIVLVQE